MGHRVVVSEANVELCSADYCYWIITVFISAATMQTIIESLLSSFPSQPKYIRINAFIYILIALIWFKAKLRDLKKATFLKKCQKLNCRHLE